MRVTQADMDSRKRMANLRMALTAVMDSEDFDGITYSELLIVLSELTTVWARYLRADELKEDEVTE